MNVQVRVLAAQGQAQLAMMQAQLNALSKGFTNSGRSARQFSSILGGMPLDSFGSKLQWVGRQLEYNFTLPIAAASAASFKLALDMETAFTRIEKVYGDTNLAAQTVANELNSLQGAFTALSNAYGVNQVEVLGVASAWAAAGASGIALAKSVDLTLKTMILGEIEAAKATEALIAIQAQYGLGVDDLTKAISILNVVENQTGVSLAGLIDGFSRSAGVARSAGVDIEHLAAMMAALVPATGSAAQAGNALKTIFSRLQSPTKETVEVLSLMGIEYDSLQWKSATMVDQLGILVDSFEDLSDKQKGVVSSVIASRWQINKFEVLMRDMANANGYYQKALAATADKTAVYAQMQEEVNKVLESNPRRLSIIWTTLQNAMADIVQPLIPMLLWVAEAIQRMVTAFSELDPGVQKAVMLFALLLVSIGPLIRIFGALVLAFAEIGTVLGLIFAPLLKLGPAFKSAATWVSKFGNTVSSAIGSIPRLLGTGLLYFAMFFSHIRTGFAASLAVMSWFVNGMTNVLAAAMLSTQRIIAVGTAAWVPVWAGAVASIRAIMIAFTAGIPALWSAMLLSIQRMTMLIAPGITTTWTAVMLGMQRITAIAAAGWAAVTAAGMLAVQRTVATAKIGMSALWAGLFVSMRSIAIAGWAAVTATMAAGAKTVSLIMVGMGGAVGRVWRALAISATAMGAAISFNFAKGFAAGMAFLRGLLPKIVAMIRGFSIAAMAALTGPWGIAITAVIVLLMAFWDEVKAIWRAMVNGTIAAFNALPAGIQGAMQAVVNVVRSAVMAVYQLFSYLNPWARHSPSLVENVTTGMAEIRKQYASASNIADVFRKAGTDLAAFAQAIAKVKQAAENSEFDEIRASLKKIAADAIPEFDALVRILNPLREALADLKTQMDAQQAVVNRWKASLDAANAALDNQQKILDNLQKVADGYYNQLQAAQSQLDYFASAPLKGMKAMEDAIFANQMAQKKLNLEMMNLEDSIGTVEEFESRMAALNGQLELMSGERANLQDMGAGSDILGTYDQEIQALERQREAMDESIQPILDLQDAIDELARRGERLDLENSLAFDELNRQIQDAVNNTQELTFEEIISGVTEYRAEVDRLQDAYNRANAAVAEQQKVVDQYTMQRDAIQARYEAELAYLEEIQTEYQQVEQMIQDIESALRDVGSAADSINRAREATSGSGAGGGGGAGSMSPGAENFMGAAGGNFPDPGMDSVIGREGGFGDQSSLIDQFTADMQQQVADMFGGFSFTEPIKKAWDTAINWLKTNIGPSLSAVGAAFGAEAGNMNPFSGMTGWVDTVKGVVDNVGGWLKSLWALIGPDVIDTAKNAWDALKDAFFQIQPEIAKFRDLAEPMGKLLMELWNALKPVLAIVLGLILMVVKTLISGLAEGIGPAIRMISSFVSGMIQFFRGLLEFFLGVFTGDWKLAWQGVQDIFGGIWNAIWGVFSNAVKTILGLFKGMAQGIIDFATWLWDELVGHSIIPDIVNGIIKWFQMLYDVGTKIISTFVNGIKALYENVVKPVFDAWGKLWEALKNIVAAVVSAMSGQWAIAVAKVQSAWNSIKSALNFIKDAYNGLRESVAKAIDKVIDYMNNFVNKMNGLRNRFSFAGLFDGIKSAFTSAINWIIGKWNNLSFGVGPFSAETPNIGMLARGGFVTRGATAIVGEGRKGYPEFVIPTDPLYRKRALDLFQSLGSELGVSSTLKQATVIGGLQRIMSLTPSAIRATQFLAKGGVIGGGSRVARKGVQYVAHTEQKTFNFYGNLEFPNVSDGDDVEEFLANLEAIIRGS